MKGTPVDENLNDLIYGNMISVATMSANNLVPPPLPPSRRPANQGNGPRRPSVSNKGRPLPPTPKSPPYQNFELPTNTSSNLKKCETLPNIKTVHSEAPLPPSPRSQSLKSPSSRGLLPPRPGTTNKFSLGDEGQPPALPPPRTTGSRRNPRSPLPPSSEVDSPRKASEEEESESLEDRFRFHKVEDLPPPEEYSASKKTYASKMKERRQKRGPPE